jgi:MscS family membrane protein
MPEILKTEFYGNTIAAWFLALGLILASITIGRIAYWLLGKYINRLTKKTNRKWDSILVASLRLPLTIGLILIGIRFCINILDLNNTFELWVGRIYHILFVINASWVIARITDSFFQEFVIPFAAKTSSDLSEMIIPFFQKGIKLLIWSLGIIIGLNNAGYDVGALIAGLGIGGVAVALAARNTISNVFGGITIFLDQPFKIGDKIKVKSRVSGIEGKVLEVGLRITSLESPDGTVIMVPNATFAIEPVENISWEPSKKITQILKLSRTNSIPKIETCLSTLQNIIQNDPDLLEPIKIGLSKISDSCLEILLVYCVRKEVESLEVQTRINLSILREFESHKIIWADSQANSEFDKDRDATY